MTLARLTLLIENDEVGVQNFLQGALVICVFLHSSQFRSFGNALIHCDSLNQLLVEELDHVEPKDQVLRCLTLKLLRPRDFQRNSFNHPGKSCNRSLRAEFGSRIALLFTGLRSALLRAESCDDDDKMPNWNSRLRERDRERQWGRSFPCCMVSCCRC